MNLKFDKLLVRKFQFNSFLRARRRFEICWKSIMCFSVFFKSGSYPNFGGEGISFQIITFSRLVLISKSRGGWPREPPGYAPGYRPFMNKIQPVLWIMTWTVQHNPHKIGQTPLHPEKKTLNISTRLIQSNSSKSPNFFKHQETINVKIFQQAFLMQIKSSSLNPRYLWWGIVCVICRNLF